MSRRHQCVKMAPLQHKKKHPNNGSYHCLGINMCTMSVTSPWWPQMATMDNEQGAWNRSWAPHVSFFFLFFFLTNMNFELNRLCHSHLTPLPTTPQRCQCKTAPCSQKKCPNNGSYRHLGLDVHATSPPWTTNKGSRHVLSPPCMFFFLFFMLTWIF